MSGVAPGPAESGGVRVERAGDVARVTLERPAHNVLSRPLNRALAEAMRALAEDRSIAAVVLDGGASRGFSAGVEAADHTPERVEAMLADFHSAVRAVEAAPSLTVASIHGFALGGGLELALACDLVIAEADARLGFPEIALGCYPPVAAALLPGRVGWSRACELVLGGEPITVEDARAMGVVNRVAAPGARREETDRFLAPFLSRSPAVVREAKRALREGAGSALGALSQIERRYLGSLMALDDAREGIQAFLDKRPPRFGNR